MAEPLPPNRRPRLRTHSEMARLLGKGSIIRQLLDLLVLIVCIYMLVNLATVRYRVDGSSMEPTFRHGEMLLTSRLHYLIGDPQRGDVVVFHAPQETPGLPREDYVKRVIGLPGETVTLRETLVFVNGELLIEPYIAEPCSPSSCPDGEWHLGHNEYFVMGDNRNASSDSRRFSEMVRREHLTGKVVLRYWPPDVWGFVGKIIGYAKL